MPYSGTLCKVDPQPTLKSKKRAAQEGGRKNNAAREPTLGVPVLRLAVWPVRGRWRRGKFPLV